MKLILARHGNTFGPQDKVTWVGSTNDLPLVEEGLAQAQRFGAAPFKRRQNRGHILRTTLAHTKGSPKLLPRN